MPAILNPRTGFPLAALALGLSVAAALPGAAAAKMLPDHPADHHEARDEHGSLMLVSGSGAVAAVEYCNGEIHVATAAGGANLRALPAMGCDDPGHDTAAVALGGTGAMAATTGGLALAAPAATAASLGELAVVNAVLGAASETEAAHDMGGHHGGMDEHAGGVHDMGHMGEMGGMHDMGHMAMHGACGCHAMHGGMMGMSRGDGNHEYGLLGVQPAAEAAATGPVTALPVTGVGAGASIGIGSGVAGNLALGLLAAIAAAGSAGGGLALRRRTVVA